MHSLLLLVAVSGLIAVPGVPAALLAFRPGQAGPPAMAAAAFGLGFTATGGCAFALAAAHAFTLAAVLGCWLAVSAALWAAAWRYGSPREHAAALAAGIREQRLPLAAGTVILVALLILHLRYLYLLNGPRYVYYLNGMQIARAGGIPAATLEYGQAWPPATDKVYLDSFTGIVALLSPNPVPGPGVLLLIATFGSVLGLWAVAWETGLRWASALLPVLCAGNQFILPGLSITYTEYRAEDFGRAVACCALAAGIVALREPSGRTCLAAAAVLAAASGSHLIPVLAVVLALGGVAIWQALSARGRAARLAPLAWCAALLALAAAGGAAVRAFAGGTLGLAGAQDPAGYHAVRTWFDPTAYLFNGEFLRRAGAGGWHWYLPPSQVIDTMVTGIARLPWWQTMALLVIPVAAAAALALRRDRGAAAAAGLGLVVGGIGVALLFDLRFPVYVDATFGMRRLWIYVSAGLFLLALGLLDLLPEAAARLAGRPRSGRVAPSARAARVAPAAAGCVIAVAATAVLVPGSVGPASLSQVSAERAGLVTWLRTRTPCDAVILADQRTEGMFTALTGRVALLEGMGPFLRTARLPYVVGLMLQARAFFADPVANEAFLGRHHVSYVVLARTDQLLGYAAPVGRPDYQAVTAVPFLRPAYQTPAITVYRVAGAGPAPPLPRAAAAGLRCQRTRVQW